MKSHHYRELAEKIPMTFGARIKLENVIQKLQSETIFLSTEKEDLTADSLQPIVVTTTFPPKSTTVSDQYLCVGPQEVPTAGQSLKQESSSQLVI